MTEQEHDPDAERDTASGLATEPEDLAESALLSDPAVDEDLETLLGFIRDARGFDFTGYKRSSVGRRVRRRMQELGYESIAEYRDFLEADADEFTALFNTILINLTGFFRDAGAWKYIESHIVPEIIARHPEDGPIRVWSAGCATGEEAYTLAMIFANVLGVADTARRVKIYATDIDLDALAQARQGVYSERSISDVPEQARNSYFTDDLQGRGWAIIPSLRRTVVFGRLDLTSDPPISRVDLLACRNMLMYLNAETQGFVIPRLHYALREGGYLLLGRAEMVLRGGAGRFSPVSLKHRIFVTPPDMTPPYEVAPSLTSRHPFDTALRDGAEPAYPLDLGVLASDDLGDTLAEVLVDGHGIVVSANDFASEAFGVTAADVHRPFAELPIATSPLDLTGPVARVLTDARSADLGAVVYHHPDGRSFEFEIRIVPVLDGNGRATAASLTFADVRTTSKLREGYRLLHEALETAYEELQSTNEELVTSNEELQSSYEELETSNEELQSANEELETTNEELRSSNDELESTNVDLKTTGEAVDQLNDTLVEANRELVSSSGFHRRVMDNFPGAIVLLNSHLLIEEWNRAAADLWGLREGEVVGEPFFGVDFGLPLEALQDPVRASRAPGASPVTLALSAVNAAGEPFTCRVQVIPISGRQPGPTAMLIMEAVKDGGR